MLNSRSIVALAGNGYGYKIVLMFYSRCYLLYGILKLNYENKRNI